MIHRANCRTQRGNPHALQPRGDIPCARQTPLVLRSYVAPTYPQRAAIRGTEGWVDVEFTVAADGRPRDIGVVDARPKGVFDEAALAAVAAWRYEPPAGGERRVVQRLKFDLAGP